MLGFAYTNNYATNWGGVETESLMSMSRWCVAALVLSMMSVMEVRAEADAAPEVQTKEVVKEKAEKAEKPAKPPRLVKPWSGLTDLTPEQQTKIADLRKSFNEQRKAIDVKENEEIMALLSEEQKAEVEKMTEKKTVESKKKSELKVDAPKKQDAPTAVE